VNRGTNNVMKVQSSTGAVLGTFTVSELPIAIAFDGDSVLVANFYGNSISKL